MIPIKDILIVLFPICVFFFALYVDQYQYRKSFIKKLNKKKKDNVIKLYNKNYPLCGGGFIEPEDLISKEKDHAK